MTDSAKARGSPSATSNALHNSGVFMPRISLFRAPLILVALAPSSLLAQTSTSTPNIGLQLPQFNSSGWQITTNQDWQRLDLMLSGNQPIPALAVTGNLSVGGIFSAPNLTFSAQQIANGLGFTPAKNDLSNVSNPAAALAYLGGFPAQVPAAWATGTTYTLNQLTIGSDGVTYISLGSGNIGNDPTTAGSTSWAKFAGSPVTSSTITSALGFTPVSSAFAGNASNITSGTLSTSVLPTIPYSQLSGAPTLAAGSNVTLATSGGVTTISSAGGGGASLPASTAANQIPVYGATGSTSVTPTTLTPGFIGALSSANNLSDLASPSAALSTLGGLPAQTPSVYASGTTYAKSALATDATGDTFISLQAANTGNALPSPITTPTAYWALFQKAGSATPLSPAGSTSGQLIASGGDGNPTVALSAAQQRAYDNALMVLKEVTDNPRTDATSTSTAWYTGSGCANSADATGTNGSSCAINAALQYTLAQGKALSSNPQGQVPCVYLPNGNYLIDSPGIYMPWGTCLIGDGENVNFKAVPGTSYSLLTAGKVRNSYQTAGLVGQLGYTVVRGIKFVGGDTPTSQNTLLENDADGFIAENLVFANTAGAAYRQNKVERVTLMRPAFYNNRQAMNFAGDDNETFIFYPTGVANGELNGAAPSGSPFGNYCYGESCVAGKYPTAGTSSAPTLLYPNTHAAIDVERAVELHFIGGDMKDNTMSACFRFSAVTDVSVDGTYCEAAASNAPGQNSSPSVILGGQAARTTLTGSITTATVGGYSVYEVPVADTSWFYMNYGQLQDIPAGFTDPQPTVFIPKDYVPGSTTASAYCPGINQGQYERVSEFVTVGTSLAVFGARNANGVYNSTSNPTGVPANYAWDSCTSPATVEDASSAYNGGNAGITLAGHFESFENSAAPGTVFNGYQWVNGFGAGPTEAEIAIGITPSNGISTPGPDFFTQNGAPGDPAPYVSNLLTIKQPTQMFNGINPYTGSIAVSHPAVINMEGGALSADGTWNDPYALALDTTTAGLLNTNHVQLITQFGYGLLIANPMYGNTKASEVQLSIPALGYQYENQKNLYWHQMSYFAPNTQSSNYISGINFQNNFNLTSGSAAGQVKPQSTFHCYGPPAGTDAGCSFDLFNYATNTFSRVFTVDLTNNTVTSNAPLYANSGVLSPGNYNSPSTSQTIAVGGTLVASPASSGVIYTLPAATPAGSKVKLILANGNPFSIATVSGSSMYINGTKYTSTTGVAFPGSLGTSIEWTADANNNWIAQNLAEIGVETVAGNSGTATLTANSSVHAGSVTFTPASAVPVNAAALTFTFAAPTANQAKACTLVPQNANAATVMADYYSSIATGASTSGWTVYTGATAWPAATYIFGEQCTF
jgi:hypothetical protein